MEKRGLRKDGKLLNEEAKRREEQAGKTRHQKGQKFERKAY